MSLIHLAADVSVETVVKHLKEDGYCIIDEAISADVVDAINQEIHPYLYKTDGAENNALGKKTRRCGAMPARSPSSHQVIMHPTVVGATQALLGENATTIQLNLTQLIAVGPGEKAQFLHRDEYCWDFFDHFPPEVHLEVSTIWAMDDFTDENGATRVIPNSHTNKLLPHEFDPAETFAAEMKKGSVLIYTGKTIHGAGENKSDQVRRALNIDYCVGWLRQEENQYLSVPIEMVRTFPEDLRNMLGYQLGGASVGYVREFEEPHVALFPEQKGDPKIYMKMLSETAKFSKTAKSVIELTT
jgi:ectoine hydroxylase-related dioxygenase (phytanoyl-CoA dioxygenase family)